MEPVAVTFASTGALVVLAVLVLALAGVLFALARCRGTARRLRGERDTLAERTWLEEFRGDVIYTLLARGGVSVEGRPASHGVVMDEEGELRPFLVPQDMSHLTVGDSFSAVRGRLLRFDGATTPATLAATATAARTGTATPAPDAEGSLSHAVAGTPSPAPVAAPPPQTPSPAPALATSAAAPPPAATPVAPALPDDDAADRTIMYQRPSGRRDEEAALPYLEVVAGPDTGRRVPAPFGIVRMGRDARNELALTDTGCSRVHCTVSYVGNVFVVADNGSTNGTLCNGEKVERAALGFDDVIELGETRVRFSCPGYDLKDKKPASAIEALEQCLARQPDFLNALKVLAFLLERDIARKREAEPVWKRIAALERGT